MSTDGPPIGRGTADLFVVLAGVVASLAVFVPSLPQTVAGVLAVPLFVVLPGYVLVATLFPTAPGTPGASDPPRSPPWSVRLALAVLASAHIVAVVGAVLIVAGRLTLPAVVIVLAAGSCLGVITAWARRRRQSADERADSLGVLAWRDGLARTGLSGLQAAAVVLGALALLAAGTYAAAAPVADEPYSETALLGPDRERALGSNGTLDLEADESLTVHLRIENHEGRTIRYGVVGRLQQVDSNGTVRSSESLQRDRFGVADGARIDVPQSIEASPTADRLRLQYLIYTGPIPADPDPDNAAFSLRQWISVTGGAS